MNGNENTQYFNVNAGKNLSAKEILRDVYLALSEKGYSPINQMVGYLLSGDPTYITAHKGAREKILKFSREEFIETAIKCCLKKERVEKQKYA